MRKGLERMFKPKRSAKKTKTDKKPEKAPFDIDLFAVAMKKVYNSI